MELGPVVVVAEADDVDDGRSRSIPRSSVTMPAVADVAVELVRAGGGALGERPAGLAADTAGGVPGAVPGDFAAVGVEEGSSVGVVSFVSLVHRCSSRARAAARARSRAVRKSSLI